MVEDYHPQEIEAKWRKFWQEKGIDKIDLWRAKKPFYNLMMYPYPSAEGLHVGNVYSFTGADIYGRYQQMKGFEVFEPIGFDSGGIHSENYALKLGVHPKIQIPKNVRHFRQQLKRIGCRYDWDHAVDVMDPTYYRWTQWLFIQLFKAGLAYKKKASVIWCPACKTTLSDEQTEKKSQKDKKEVLTVCERCKTPVIKKELTQWFLAITQYAERLLQNSYKLDWTEKVLKAQRRWLGKSTGAEIKFLIFNSQLSLRVFTTRPDTLHGCTFICLSPEYPQLAQIVQPAQQKAVAAYLEESRRRSVSVLTTEEKEKTGVFTGAYALNPVNGRKLPIYVADYVLTTYGSGAVMGVPSHDSRDFAFAEKYGLEFKMVVSPKEKIKLTGCYEGPGVLINSQEWNGWRYPEDLTKVIDWLEKKGMGKRAIQYKLRDWCVSRQRYWGPPIPMIFCRRCAQAGRSWYTSKEGEAFRSKIKNKFKKLLVENAGWYPVPETELPLLLPDTDDYLPGEAEGKPPLARLPEFVKTRCPACGGPAERETDVSDTFLDSSWYFLAYPNIGTAEWQGKRSSKTNNLCPFNPELMRKWLPVDQYTGGAEHAVLHLLYSRFITMVLHDLGYLEFEEPFPHFYAHGLIIKEGAKMSKSRGNVINPDFYIAKFGADTLRMYLMFLGPFSEGGDFRDTGMGGMFKFLRRVWRLFQSSTKTMKLKTEFSNPQEAYWVHKTLKKVGEDIQKFKYNTAIAAIMELVNFLEKEREISLKAKRILNLMLAPFVPYLAEELNAQLSGFRANFISIHQQSWPQYDPRLIKEEEVIIVVQVNGKVREKLKVPKAKATLKEEIERLAKNSERIKKFLAGRPIRRTIFVPGRLFNFVQG